MKKIKTLFMPLMACSFLVGCNKQPDVPPTPPKTNEFFVTETDVIYDSSNRYIKVELDWTFSDHSIEFSDLKFTLSKQAEITSTVDPSGVDARPLPLTITFAEELEFSDQGVLSFHYNDKTAKKEGEGKVKDINIKLIPPVPVVTGGGLDLTYMRMNAGKGNEVRFSYECKENVDDLKVYWGDGEVDNLNYHTYEKPGFYSIYITGHIDNIALVGDDGKILADGNDQIYNIAFSNYVTKLKAKSFNTGGFTSIRSVFVPNTVIDIGSKAISFAYNGAVYCFEDRRGSGWQNDCFVKGDITDVVVTPHINLYLGEDKILYAVYDDGTPANSFASVYICCDLTLKDAVVADKIEINNIEYPVTAIWDSAFYDLDTLESVVIPGTVKSIGESVFIDCNNLKSVTLNEGLEKIEFYAFRNTGITEIKIPSTIKSIEGYAFLSCHQLEKVTFESSSVVKEFKLEQYVFDDCPNINQLILGKGVTKIGQYSIDGFAIKELALPSTITGIDLYGINNCKLLTTIDASKFSSGNIPKAEHNAISYANPGAMIEIKIAAGLQESNFTTKGWPASSTGAAGFKYINVN